MLSVLLPLVQSKKALVRRLPLALALLKSRLRESCKLLFSKSRQLRVNTRRSLCKFLLPLYRPPTTPHLAA